ncbi:TWO-COMPONENT RESPONSE REGULATOR [Salix purpurea]|uniref:TWO-COMPONENT RESPONSE REGULATOR n=1 Tax=Salix purpurea TaxID=77065 RepID=A0A9Q0UC14_SALPP|nr:TWO-COMPONENT RESPONSE REGULATOR [Salix purpurea]
MLPLTNRFAEQNHIVEDERKEIRDGIMGEGQELSEEDESQINEDGKYMKDKGMELFQVQNDAQAVIQSQQQQSQGPLVLWERFLPLRSLKVLLVENDDSTRHVVSALLRNCGYEVSAVSNGLQAWKVLQDLTNHIDLVLTEVAMPCLSGIGLLSKIVSHKTCGNIPVIMMSSHDSMNLVFKCLSKGAVDFLVKPIRKNELKILWQHVWRRCHSASGSGSESAVRTQKSTKSKGADESDNDTDSNDDDGIGSVGLNARDGSDNGSGTQSSWTNRAVEVDSPKPMSLWNQDHLADPPDSTCAQVIHSRPEACDNSWVPPATSKKCGEQDDELDNIVMGKDLETGAPRIPNLQFKDPIEKVLTNIADNDGERFPEIKPKQDGGHLEKRQQDLNSEERDTELRNQGNDLKGSITNSTNPQMESLVLDVPNGLSSNQKNEVIYETKEVPSFELSLKRLRDIGDARTGSHDRNVLRHSDLSAFSRYNSASTTDQAPSGNGGSYSEAAKTESLQNLQSNSNSTPSNQRTNGSSNNNGMGSTTNFTFAKPSVISDKPTLKSTVKCPHPSAFQPVQNDHTGLPQPVIQGKGDAPIANTILVQSRDANQKGQVQHRNHCVHNMSPQQQLANHDDLSLNTAAAAPHCGSSNMLSTPMEGNAGNYSLNGSASGSDHGSNGQNGSCIDLNPRGIKMEGNSRAVDKGETPGPCDESGSVSGVGRNRLTLREAALSKFRQKRKERCFEKKVRYQSRKKLAEQRPRIRGQFVRQAGPEHKDEDARS